MANRGDVPRERAELLGHVVAEDADELGVELFGERVEVFDDVVGWRAIDAGLVDERAQEVLGRRALRPQLQALSRDPDRRVGVARVAEQPRRDLEQVESIAVGFFARRSGYLVGR